MSQHRQTTLNFILTGHTKFLPDAAFEHIKQTLNVTKVESIQEIANVVNKYEYCTGRCKRRKRFFIAAVCLEPVLGSWFQEIPDNGKFHHFRFTCEKPRTALVKQYATSPEIKINILKCPAIHYPSTRPNNRSAELLVPN